MGNSFVAYENVQMLLAPQDIVATDTPSNYMDIRYAQRAHLLVSIGAITTATATDTLVVTVEAASAADATEAAIAFAYRLSGANTANTWGAVTTCATTGVSIASTDDNKMVWITLDPAAVQAEVANARYVRGVIASPADMAAALVAVHGFTEPRYVQTTHISATASASA